MRVRLTAWQGACVNVERTDDAAVTLSSWEAATVLQSELDTILSSILPFGPHEARGAALALGSVDGCW